MCEMKQREMNQSEIGDLLRECRVEHKYTQKDLGILLGVSESSINKYEHGKTKIPPFKLALACRVLHVEEFFYKYMPESVQKYLLKFKQEDMQAENDMQKAKEAAKKQYNENILSKTSEQPIKKNVEIDALAQLIHDEIMKSFSKDAIKDYIYAALEKRLKESHSPDTDTKK